MGRKKKVQKTAYEIWLEQKEALVKELEEVKRISNEAERLATQVAYKAQQLKESDPSSCKNCQHKYKCPFYNIQTGERKSLCLKEGIEWGFKRGGNIMLATDLFWKNQGKNHIYN